MCKEVCDKTAKSSTTNITDVNESDFDKVANSNTFVIADFWAEWCRPCKQTEPMFRRVAEKYAGKAAFVRVNADQNQELMQKHNIMSIPAFIVIKNGQIMNQPSAKLDRTSWKE